MPNPFTMLGPKTRKTIYMIFGFAVILAGAAAVYYNGTSPDWLDGINRVLTYLAAPISVLAASNVPGSPEEIAEIVDDAKVNDGGLFEGDDYDPDRLI